MSHPVKKMKSLSEGKGHQLETSSNGYRTGKRPDNRQGKDVADNVSLDSKSGALTLNLKRTVQLKRYPIIARVIFQRERRDLVSLLQGMKADTGDMPPRLVAYLKQEKLWDESGVTDKGQHVIDTGLFESLERGLYHIWYTDNDPLLETRPVMMQRDTAFFCDEKNALKKGADAACSEFRVDESVQLQVLEEQLTDSRKSELKLCNLQLSSLYPEVICSAEKTAEVNLEWRLSPEHSEVSITGQLDMLQFSQNQSKQNDHPEKLDLNIHDFGEYLGDIMSGIAGAFEGRWNEDTNVLDTALEQIKRYPSSVQQFQVGSFNQSNLQTELGLFQSFQAQHIPIQPINQQDAEDWHSHWLEAYYRQSYRSSADARKQQAQWLDHKALRDFDLTLKENQSLLSELSRESQPEAYWHAAAMADLTPSRSRTLRLPISLVDGDELDLDELIQQLTDGDRIGQFIYSDRYVHTSRQSRNLNAVADCLTDAEGVLLTLDKQHGKKADLPCGWTQETLQKQHDNHGRYWILIGTEHNHCWECSSGLDFICESDSGYTVDGVPTFTPKETNELPQYLQDQIKQISTVEVES
jgi:hypothetical protein